jgi:hypothetical protein
MRVSGRRSALALAVAVGLSGAIFTAQSPFPGQDPPKSFEPLPLIPPLPVPKWELSQNLIYRLPQGWAYPRWPEWFKFPQLPPLEFFPPSGYVPPKCRPVAATSAVLDCWLRAHPLVATHIRWEFADAPGSAVSWERWSDGRRRELRDAFQAARDWRASGFADWPGLHVADPPDNREAPHLGPEDVRTVYSGDDAWEIYLSHVAVTMASEIDAWVPWSIRFHGPEPLRDLLDGTFRQFVFDRNDGTFLDSVYPGYLMVGSVVPSHAAVTYKFLHDNDLIGASPRKTIARVIEWSKRMWHGISIDRPQLQEQIDLWQYPGLTPVSRITNGSIIPGEYLVGTPMLANMSPGCFGTSDLYVWVFRAVNIPVRRVYGRETCGHISPYWSAEGLYLSHGDDPYSQAFNTIPDLPASVLPINESTWALWFPTGSESCANVSRRVVDLNLTYTSNYLVGQYCQDQRAGLTRAAGSVYGLFSSIYTLPEVEARGVYDRLAVAAESSSVDACVRWRATRTP